MRRPLVAGNWKMNGTRADAAALVKGIVQGLGQGTEIDVALCPPFVLIPLIAELLSDHAEILYGAQDLSAHRDGAYTGEISGAMLRDYGCTYVLVGHSERRAYHGEDDELVAQKFGAALDTELLPILCVGETLTEREAGHTHTIIVRQLEAVLAVHGVEPFARAVIAYEPVWAIGTGKTATPGQAQEMHDFIRQQLTKRDSAIGENSRILYGGSVKAANAAALFAQPDVDGGLVGGASLVTDEFVEICRAAV
ncbi:MAG: triose-phosphate isomerase [Acidiferrobacterales bacterium]